VSTGFGLGKLAVRLTWGMVTLLGVDDFEEGKIDEPTRLLTFLRDGAIVCAFPCPGTLGMYNY